MHLCVCTLSFLFLGENAKAVIFYSYLNGCKNRSEGWEGKRTIVSDYENWRSFYLKMSYYPFCYVCHIFHFFLIFTANLLASHHKLLLGILAESLRYSVRLCFTHSSIFSPLHSSAKVIIFNVERHPGIPLLNTLDWSLIVLRMKTTFMVHLHRSGWCASNLFSSFILHSPPLSCCSSYSHLFFPYTTHSFLPCRVCSHLGQSTFYSFLIYSLGQVSPNPLLFHYNIHYMHSCIYSF